MRVVEWIELIRDGERLACCDFGGAGRPLLMLHGLAGYSGEWAGTAAALGGGFRVLGLDQRGHGRSERVPADVSRAAFVADVAAVVERLSLAPVVLVGQSMGGNTALLTAAAYPDLVQALVAIEASPEGPAPELPPRDRLAADSRAGLPWTATARLRSSAFHLHEVWSCRFA